MSTRVKFKFFNVFLFTRIPVFDFVADKDNFYQDFYRK